MSESVLLVDRQYPGVTVITFNRPDKRNALNVEMLRMFCKVMEETEKLADQRSIIINGAGTVFCTGMDLQEALQPEHIEDSTQLIGKALISIYNSPLVTVAAVQGAALAGGAGIMSACDYVVAAEGTKFGFPEVCRGLVPAQVSIILVRQLRGRDIREMLLLGKVFDPDKAKSLGLINEVVSIDNLNHRALEITDEVRDAAPHAVAETKKLLHSLETEMLSEDYKIALRFHQHARVSDEAKEGISAFLEKRPPKWATKLERWKEKKNNH